MGGREEEGGEAVGRVENICVACPTSFDAQEGARCPQLKHHSMCSIVPRMCSGLSCVADQRTILDWQLVIQQAHIATVPRGPT